MTWKELQLCEEGTSLGGSAMAHPQGLLFKLATCLALSAPPWEAEMRGPCPCRGWDNLLATKQRRRLLKEKVKPRV